MEEDLGFSSSRLDRLARFLEHEYIGNGRLPCAQLAISREGRSVRQISLGRLDVERDIPLADDAIFRIYSMTKPVTCVAAMILVERGLLSTDEPVEAYIPSWSSLKVAGPNGMIAPRRRMIVADLFRHTAGLSYSFQQAGVAGAEYAELGIGDVYGRFDLAETVEALSQIPLDYSPGESWNYSLSVDVLGYLIELVSGSSLDVFLQNEILGPLKMVDTGFRVRDEQVERLSNCYRASDNHTLQLVDAAISSPFRKPPSMLSGGGGLVSTTGDYMRFVEMMLAGGSSPDAQILSPASVAYLGQNHLPGGKDIADMSISTFSESAYPGMGFGLGFAVVTDPASTAMTCSPGELHWGGMASTLFWIDPKEKLGVVFMSQRTPSTVNGGVKVVH